jgi:hypothetical protein
MELTDDLRTAIHQQLTAKPGLKTANPARHFYRYNGGRAHASDALGVNPEQIGEAREELRRHGLCVEFDKQGRCLIESEKQFQQVTRALGMSDGRDGYQVCGNDGNRIFSGREEAKGRERFKEELRRMVREGG